MCVFVFVSATVAQVQYFYVHPKATDAAYTTADSHLVARNVSAANQKLLLFIGGTLSKPQQYEFFSLYAAAHGYHVINVSYPNLVITTLLAGSNDSMAFNKFREEICFGTSLSPVVSVDSFNSIYTRTLKLLQYLSETYPQDGWDGFLVSPAQIDWSKVAVAGHSQGSGHAAYFAKLFAVERVLMFAGPNDYSTYFNNAAPWLRTSGITPLYKHFTFLHLRDEIVPFNHQYQNISGMGMLAADDTTLVETTTSPYGYSKCLYSNLNPKTSGQYHNSVVIFSATPYNANNEPEFDPVWQYMLLSDVSTGMNEQEYPTALRIFPNPATNYLTVPLAGKMNEPCEVKICDAVGNTVFHNVVTALDNRINVAQLPVGVYFLYYANTVARFFKR